MSLANKFGISQSLLDVVQSSLDESTAYQAKVKAHMAKKGVKSLDDMSAEQKKSFFNELDAMHKAKNEEVEPVEEAESAQSKTTMKHISKPTAGEKKAAKDIKPGIAGYRDRVAMLKSAEARGALKKEEVELSQEDLDFIASLNDSDIELDETVRTPGHIKKDLEDKYGPSQTTITGTNTTQHVIRHLNDDGEDAYEVRTHELIGRGKDSKVGKLIKHTKPSKKFFKEDFDLEDFTIEEIEEFMQTEDFDQLDELSKKTLGSYVKKSSADAVNSASSHTAYGGAAQRASLDGDKKNADNWKKSSNLFAKQTAKRQAGVGKAVERLMTKEDFDLEDFTVEEIEEFMQTEDFDQLDELSKTTLGSYIKKRSHDVAAQGAITRHHAEKSEREKKDPNLGNQRKSMERADKAFAKGWKHRVNIGKAVDRLTKD